jgi:TPR repeat protein
MEAAREQKDGDSLFNAGYCLLHGMGTPQNDVLARELFLLAASKFGHFDSVHLSGQMLYEGRGGSRSVATALPYIQASYSMASHSGWIRRGLDSYMNSDYEQALLCYYRAAETGSEVAQSNAAYLIKRKLTAADSLSSVMYAAVTKSTSARGRRDERISAVLARLQTKLYLLSAEAGNRDSMLFVGHSLHEGLGVAADQTEAIWWYTRASSKGQALGSFYIAAKNHFGMSIPRNVPRAVRYYEYALRGELQPAVKTVATALLYIAKSSFGAVVVPFLSSSFEQIVRYCLSFQ